MKLKSILFFCSLFLISSLAYSQKEFKYDISQSKITIIGTSSARDWKMSLKNANLSVIALINNANIVNSIQDISFNAKVTDLDATENTMNVRAYETFKYKSNPNISFKLSNIDNFVSNQKGFSGNAVGILTMAGKSNKVSIPFKGQLSNQKLKVLAKKKINMTQWGMTPPTTMMGMMKTGKDVTLDFYLVME